MEVVQKLATGVMGRFAAALNTRMDESGTSIRDLATGTGITYEHARRLSRGLSVPSRYLCRVICQLLEMEFEATYALVVQDNIERRYGVTNPPKAHPEPVQQVWEKLTPSQQRDFFVQMESIAKRNSKRRTA